MFSNVNFLKIVAAYKLLCTTNEGQRSTKPTKEFFLGSTRDKESHNTIGHNWHQRHRKTDQGSQIANKTASTIPLRWESWDQPCSTELKCKVSRYTMKRYRICPCLMPLKNQYPALQPHRCRFQGPHQLQESSHTQGNSKLWLPYYIVSQSTNNLPTRHIKKCCLKTYLTLYLL